MMEQNYFNPGNPYDIIGFFNWPEIGLQPGFIMTMSGPLMGSDVTKTLIVPQLQMTSFDLENDTVSGIATPDSQLEVCINFPDHCASHYINQQMVLEIGLRIIKIRRKGKQQISGRVRPVG